MRHLVITIGCEYGAKGNAIGRKIAEDLNIKFYNRELVDEIIEEVGIPKEIMEKVEEGGTIAGKGAEGDVRSCDSCAETDYPQTGRERILCDHRTFCGLYSQRFR